MERDTWLTVTVLIVAGCAEFLGLPGKLAWMIEANIVIHTIRHFERPGITRLFDFLGRQTARMFGRLAVYNLP